MKTGKPRRNTGKNDLHDYLFLIIFTLIIIAVFTNNGVASGDPPRYHSNGKLTLIQKNKYNITLTIDKKNYTLDKSALVVNFKDRPTPIEKISVPTDVNFVYGYNNSYNITPLKINTPHSKREAININEHDTLLPIITFIKEITKD